MLAFTLENLFRYWPLFLLAIWLTWLITDNKTVLGVVAKELWKSTYSKTVVALIALLTVLYFSLKDSWPNLELLKLSNYFDFSTFVFAVVAGHFGYRQLSLARYDSLVKNAESSLVNDRFSRAIWYYKRATVLEKNFNDYVNLAELCVIQEKLSDFSESLSIIESMSVESKDDYEVIIFKYLCLLRSIVLGNFKKAEEDFRDIAAYSEVHPQARSTFARIWSFKLTDTLEKTLPNDTRGVYADIKDYLGKDREKSLIAGAKYYTGIVITNPESISF